MHDGDAACAGPSPFLADIARQLREKNVRVIDLTATFQAAARERLERRELIYWPDDTHWNAAGAALAAETIARELK